MSAQRPNSLAPAYSGMFATPMHLPPRDFSTENLQCRWQELPVQADTLAMARVWLQTLSVDGAGLHRDPRGRPRLPTGVGDIGWSHSGGRLLMAYAPQGVVGVDVEASARTSQAVSIARRYFTGDEVAALSALNGASRQQAFLRLWCAKEAVLKAAGRGIAFGLHRVAFDVSGDTPRMIDCDPALGQAGEWSLHQFAPEPGFIAVLATKTG